MKNDINIRAQIECEQETVSFETNLAHIFITQIDTPLYRITSSDDRISIKQQLFLPPSLRQYHEGFIPIPPIHIID